MENAGKILSGTTRNSAVNIASLGTRCAAGYALTLAALWNLHSPLIAATTISIGSSTLMLALRQAHSDKLKIALNPIMLSATSAAFLFACLRYADINQSIAAYFDQHGLSRWTWNWAAQCTPEQIAHINQLLSNKQAAFLAMATGLCGLGAQAYILHHQPRRRKI